MITVRIVRDDENNRIVSFAVEGHANYAKHGEDIVCAGVSAVSVGTVNAVEALAGVELPAKMKNGFLSSKIPLFSDKAIDEKVQLLMESMVVMLDTIAKSYENYVSVHDSKLK